MVTRRYGIDILTRLSWHARRFAAPARPGKLVQTILAERFSHQNHFPPHGVVIILLRSTVAPRSVFGPVSLV